MEGTTARTAVSCASRDHSGCATILEKTKMAETKELFQRYLPDWVVEWLDYYARAAAENPVEFILSGG